MLRAAVVPVVLVALLALAGVVLGRIYADPLLAQLVAGAAVGSVGAGVAVRGLPSWAPAPISVLLLGGYAWFALRLAADRADLTGPLPQLAGDALHNGIPRLLTAMIPVEPTPDTVAVPVVATWLAGLAATELAVRGGRVLLGCAAPTTLYAGVLYVIGPNADTAGWPTVVFAGAIAVALAVTGRRAADPAAPAAVRKALGRRPAVAGVGGLVVVVALIALVGPWLSGRVQATPVDPRQYVEPPQVDSLDESPLNRLSGWALQPERRLFDVTADPAVRPSAGAAPSPSASGGAPSAGAVGRNRIRLAVLPDFDGVTWRVGATYRNAGRVLPSQLALPGARVDTVHERITIAELTGRLLPVVPTPTSVEGARVAYDPGSGTLIRPEGLTAGLTYSVTSARQRPDYNLLPSASVPSGDAVARYLGVGVTAVPGQLRALADELAKGNGAPYDRAVQIEQFLQEHYRLVADAPSGHALPNLTFFLFGPRDGGAQQGTSEQFAAAYAVLGRLTGLPTRVVVGFRAPANGGPVTAGDAVAWPEVLFDGLGWVEFDPLPVSQAEPRPVEDDFTPKPESKPSTSDAPAPTVAASASTGPAVAAPAPKAGAGLVVAAGVSGTAILLVAAAIVTLAVLRRAQRRRRVTAPIPADRVTGAWLELTDALRLAGHPPPIHLAATEVAAFASAAGFADGTSAAGLADDTSARDLRRLRTSRLRRLRIGRVRPAAPPRPGTEPGVDPGHAQDGGAGRPPTAPPGEPHVAPVAGQAAAAKTVIAGAGPLPGPTAGPNALAGVVPASGGKHLSPVPLPPLDDVVAGVNANSFAPGVIGAAGADRAARQAVAYADALRDRRSWWRRLWWRVNPGPLRWNR